MQLTSINTIKELFQKYGFSFSKSLGQNFLINPAICPKIAELGGSSNIGVLEIGTGIGVLTKELAIRAKKVVAIEIDRTLEPILKETLAEFDNIEIIFDDILNVDIKKLIEEKFSGLDVVCCANLPYYITSPVIMSLLQSETKLKSLTVMVQKEAGERLIAMPGTRECGAISAAVRYYSQPKKLFSVSSGSFKPRPSVESMVIKLDIRKHEPPAINDEIFFKVVKSAFSERRKQVINPLSNAFGLSKEALRDIFRKANVNETARAENLTMNDLINISNLIYKGI